jgi:hypothetical protein
MTDIRELRDIAEKLVREFTDVTAKIARAGYKFEIVNGGKDVVVYKDGRIEEYRGTNATNEEGKENPKEDEKVLREKER